MLMLNDIKITQFHHEFVELASKKCKISRIILFPVYLPIASKFARTPKVHCPICGIGTLFSWARARHPKMSKPGQIFVAALGGIWRAGR